MDNIVVKKRDYLQSRLDTILNTILYKRSINNLNQGHDNLAVFAFDHIGHSITIEGTYEKEELEIIRDWLYKNNLIRGVALDIGANIGNHSIFFSKIYKWVYSFEPHPITLKLLNLNVELFTNNTTVYPIGLSDKEASLPFFMAKNANMMGAKFIFSDLDKYQPDEIKNVKVTSLDTILELKDVEIGLIKIDVEGVELKVLHGAKAILEKNKPIILFEHHLEDFENGKTPVIEYLRSLGYAFFIVKKTPVRSGNNSRLKRISNLFVENIFGRKYEIIACDNLKPDFYNMIIAVPNK